MNVWAPKTLQDYKSSTRRIVRFETKFGVQALVPMKLTSPPISPAIAVMWAQQQYSLEKPARKHIASEGDRIPYNTCRKVRTAAAQFYMVDLQIAHPEEAMQDSQHRGHLTLGCIPTEQLGYTMMGSGMARRLGDDSKPTLAITAAQVQHITEYLEQLYQGPLSLNHQRDLAAAAVMHLTFWLGWLQSLEAFSLNWLDVMVTPPYRSGEKGLPDQCGVVEMNLLEQTKSNQTSVADVVVAYTTLTSNLSLGIWIERMAGLWPDTDEPDVAFIRGADGTHWTSTYFRHNFVYPWLYMLKQEGDPFLRAFTKEIGNRIADKYYSINLYRRGGSSHVAKRRGNK